MAAQPPTDRNPAAASLVRSALARLIPQTLGTRLALTYSALALLIVALLGVSLVATIRDFSVKRLQADLLEETLVAGDILTPLLDASDTGALDAATNRLARALGSRVTVVARDGTVLAESAHDDRTMENHAQRPEIIEALQTGAGSSVRSSTTLHAPYFYVARSIADGRAVVRMGLPLGTVDSLIHDVQRQIAAAALIAGLLMSGAGWFVARRIGEALEDIRAQATAVAAGELGVMVEPAPTRELGDLGRSFNTMTGRLRGAMAELERVRARLEATLADLSDGVVITDDAGRVVLANDAAREMLAARGSVLGVPFVEVGRDHELAEMVERARSLPEGMVERTIRHARSEKTLQAAARWIETNDERIGVVVLRDITELQRLEGIRRDFVANVSHELRTPLTSIRVLVETLEGGALNDPEVSADFLERIIGEVDRLAQMVDELLDLARLESGRDGLSLEQIEAAEVIHRAVERLAPQTERAGLRVTVRIDDGVPPLLADRSRIDQVMLNLLHNAIKFTPRGGTIAIHAARRDRFVEVQVRDTGVGVHPDELPRLFERFYKADRARRSQGTGLGLAIAKHIVQAHGGRIWAEPNEPVGTAFVFQLPVSGPEMPGLSDRARDEATAGVG